MTWTPKTAQAETWTDKTQQADTWTASSEQSESWSNLDQPTRVFDPYVFALTPTFDTGAASGVWARATEQAEVWVAA